MEGLDLIPENDEKELDDLISGKINNINLFKNEKNKKNVNKQLEEINLFNRTILNTNNWGSSNLRGNPKENSQNIFHFKPDVKDIEKEIGKNIYNTKLPRARQYTKAILKNSLSLNSSKGFIGTNLLSTMYKTNVLNSTGSKNLINSGSFTSGLSKSLAAGNNSNFMSSENFNLNKK